MTRPTRATLLAGFLPLLTIAAPAKTLHVPKEHGQIQAAIDAAADGDTIQVARGTYGGGMKVKGKHLTLASAFHVSHDAADVQQTILEGRMNGGKATDILTVSAGAELKLVGFTIQNGDHAVTNSGRIEVLHNHFTGNLDALSFESGQGIVRFNVFEKDKDDGIDMDGASAAVIEDNVIRDNKDDGIEIRLHKYSGAPLSIEIRRNVFSGNREDGLQLIDYPGKSPRTFHIERNLFLNNAMAAIGTMEDGNTKENYAGADMQEPVFIIHNTFIGGNHGITGGDNMVLLNNILCDCAATALKRVHGDSAAGPNLFHHNKTDTEDCDLNPGAFITADPQLDAEHKPKTGSPCLDAGVAEFSYNGETLTLPAGTWDGRAPDLGAFETKSGTPAK